MKKKGAGFTLPENKVKITFIERATPLVQDREHVLYGGLAPNAYKGFQIPLAESGGLAKVFTEDELRELEARMGFAVNELSLNREKNNYWHNYYIKLDKGTKMLDLSDPRDFIFYKVAKAQKNHIAPHNDRILGNHMWVIQDSAYEDQRSDAKLSLAKKAFKLLGQIENSDTKLRQVLMEAKGGARIPEDKLKDRTFLVREATKLADADPDVFVRAAEDEDLEVKGYIYLAGQNNAITRKGRYYYHLDGEKLCLPGEANDLRGAINFFKSAENQEFYMTIIDQVNNSM